MDWDKSVVEAFDQMLAKIPKVLRSTAEKSVRKKAEALVYESGRFCVEEKDLVDAFFAATPFGFHGPMKSDMESLHIDYTQYGYER